MEKLFTDDKELDRLLSKILIDIGVLPHLKGFRYLMECIKFALKQPYSVNLLMKDAYEIVAKKCNATPTVVERNIRHALGFAWNKGKVEVLNKLLGIRFYNDLERPTNGEFVALIVNGVLFGAFTEKLAVKA